MTGFLDPAVAQALQRLQAAWQAFNWAETPNQIDAACYQLLAAERELAIIREAAAAREAAQGGVGED